ncbi:hypothetical protein [Meiothermus sp.]|uniref:hypothetical protein n=1 Tax=Meiothermus sp. TaxID=1955249 RepID=UPI00307D57DB
MFKVETQSHPKNICPLDRLLEAEGSRTLRNYDCALNRVQHRTRALFDPGQRVFSK